MILHHIWYAKRQSTEKTTWGGRSMECDLKTFFLTSSWGTSLISSFTGWGSSSSITLYYQTLLSTTRDAIANNGGESPGRLTKASVTLPPVYFISWDDRDILYLVIAKVFFFLQEHVKFGVCQTLKERCGSILAIRICQGRLHKKRGIVKILYAKGSKKLDKK